MDCPCRPAYGFCGWSQDVVSRRSPPCMSRHVPPSRMSSTSAPCRSSGMSSSPYRVPPRHQPRPPQPWSRQYRLHRSTVPLATSAHDRSTPAAFVHHAPVRLPPAGPFETQRIVPPVTSTCPSRERPVGRPTSRTSASRDAEAVAEGQGWFNRHEPSRSRAATPAMRRRGPSAHHTGPSPSQTRVGVQVNEVPAGRRGTAAASVRKVGMAPSAARPAGISMVTA
ncbi:hypothetical protein SAMN05192583_1583 [Sphingomonas gellani]|uniref:Uncharacterized protein n=1 Tax=Sphingomonas gellani TaxID=1166340 RepID=A0A1H8CFA1_9SPHN|nr:hypothetical protein SAMN05192583_1583 [Sphingomonas gellani]